MADLITDGLVIFNLCGQFGWTGTPAAFAVVTTALAHEFRLHLTGMVEMYVDDILGVCLKAHLEADMQRVATICNGLLGSADRPAIAPKKTVFGRRLTVIGYDFDLNTMLVSISRKNVDKATFGFLSTVVDDPTLKVSVRDVQRLASYGSRYSGICLDMGPYVRAIYTEYTGLGYHVSKVVSVNYRRVIRVLRVLILLTSLDEHRFARPMRSFSPAAARYVIEFDASLWGVGLLWYSIERDEDGHVVSESLIGGAAVDITALQLFQETGN